MTHMLVVWRTPCMSLEHYLSPGDVIFRCNGQVRCWSILFARLKLKYQRAKILNRLLCSSTWHINPSHLARHQQSNNNTSVKFILKVKPWTNMGFVENACLCCPLRYVGVVSEVFIVLHLLLIIFKFQICVLLANLWWNINENKIKDWISTYLVLELLENNTKNNCNQNLLWFFWPA